VGFLQSSGHQISSTANTQTREAGKDIQAKSGDGTEVLISVKGYPEKSPHTQARHWFAELLFDIIVYRDEHPTAQLGIGLPDGFTTYLNLAKRVSWFKQSARFQFYWVNEDGEIRVE
jgi:hypothetical protein